MLTWFLSALALGNDKDRNKFFKEKQLETWAILMKTLFDTSDCWNDMIVGANVL